MLQLHQAIAQEVGRWRADGYPCPDYPAVAEILEWSFEEETGNLRYLRRPQLQALETYWYLRLLKGTPHIFDLYRDTFDSTSRLLEALGLDHSDITQYVLDHGPDALFERIRTDDAFVKDFKLQAVRETLDLDYPSYILALAMGAGKTVLIGAIIASEFAMALEYPGGDFVENALVFAPGKTIIESLRELAEVPYDKILPPRLHKPFSASVKLLFTRDGEKDIPVISGSSFNIVVTNTGKIRIRKEKVLKKSVGSLFSDDQTDEAKEAVANLRLQTIASLPHLAVFSDEAHHTYGRSLNTGLKRVRQTVDYLADNTNVVAVVNTTGTPYYKRQPLKDVVYWYGLAQGIEDGYLKELQGNIKSYEFEGRTEAYVEHVVKDFFHEYGDHALPNGAPAKLAMFFPQTDDLRELRPVIDRALVEVGEDPSVCLVNTSDETLTSEADIRAFNRLNDPAAPHRVILLVNKGTEGWNCPSLFACALARKLRTSNNFVLQAATRCLRQVPGNDRMARVYLSTENFSILDKQLRETYGESIAQLNRTGQETRRSRVKLRKIDVPPVVVTQVVRTVVRTGDGAPDIALTRPQGEAPSLEERTYTVAEQESTFNVLQQVGETEEIDVGQQQTDVYAAAVELAARYRIDLWTVYDELRRLYAEEDIPARHLHDLAAQIEDQTRDYEVREEEVDVALALVKPEGFEKEVSEEGAEVYTAEIVYPKDREHLVAHLEQWQDRAGELGFHYTPYDFDSNPEKNFFEQVLGALDVHPDEVEDIYFTGAITDPAKTDFYVDYKDEKGKWRRYTPDFLIRKKPEDGGEEGTGRVMIVEIKREHDRAHPVDGERGRKAMALRRWEDLNPDRLKYEMIFTATDTVPADKITDVRRFVADQDT